MHDKAPDPPYAVCDESSCTVVARDGHAVAYCTSASRTREANAELARRLTHAANCHAGLIAALEAGVASLEAAVRAGLVGFEPHEEDEIVAGHHVLCQMRDELARATCRVRPDSKQGG